MAVSEMHATLSGEQEHTVFTSTSCLLNCLTSVYSPVVYVSYVVCFSIQFIFYKFILCFRGFVDCN